MMRPDCGSVVVVPIQPVEAADTDLARAGEPDAEVVGAVVTDADIEAADVEKAHVCQAIVADADVSVAVVCEAQVLNIVGAPRRGLPRPEASDPNQRRKTSARN